MEKLFLYALQSSQCTITRHAKSLDAGQALEQSRWHRICYGASSPTYSSNVRSPHLTGGGMGQTTALSKHIAPWVGAGLWLDTEIACPSSSPGS